jgi:type I restriction enzyme M protein
MRSPTTNDLREGTASAVPRAGEETRALAPEVQGKNANGTAPRASSNFHSSGLRQKVDQLMDILWAGGVNNPMDSIEQISYLLFLRLLTERDEQLAQLDKKYKRIFSGKWSRYAWGNFVTLTGDPMFDSVRSAIESLHELPGLSSTGKLLFSRATLKIYDRPALRAVIQGINEMDLTAHNGDDLKGDMYEYLLSRISMSGTNGQFRTPRHIIAMIVALVDPQPGQRICDPACGTTGFLIAAFEHIRRNRTSKAELAKGHLIGDQLKPAQWKFLEDQAFTGYDNDANMVKIGILNLYLHRLEKANIELHNPLTTGKGGSYPGLLFDIVLANPPFAGKIQNEGILSDLNHKLNTRATELLFLKWFIDHLNPGGRAGVIVPNGVLFGSNNAATTLRELLVTQCDLQAVIGVPSGVFKPYSGVGTAALIFEKGVAKFPGTKSVWFYDMTADGFSLDDNRTPIEANDIPDVIAKWPKREEGPNSYRVPIEKIRENDWSLAAGRYKPVSAETVNHDAPATILGDVLELENGIIQRGNALLETIGRKK